MTEKRWLQERRPLWRSVSTLAAIRRISLETTYLVCIRYYWSLTHKLFAHNSPLSLAVYVPGFGSSAYPIFCGGAAEISRQLAASRAKEVVSRGECDAVKVSSIILLLYQIMLIVSSHYTFVLLYVLICYVFPLILTTRENHQPSTNGHLSSLKPLPVHHLLAH